MSTGAARIWAAVAPSTWPAPPTEMTVSALAEIETCPRRWALASAEYPGLWSGRGYPPRLALSSLAGSVVHLALETITRALVEAACGSVQDASATQVMRALGGYTKVVNDCVDRVLEKFVANPRATRLLEGARRTLRAQVPDLRTRTQALLGRVQLAATPQRTKGPTSRGPLSRGTYSEIELRARQLGWKGKVDLLVLSERSCEIVDFKTGGQDDGHLFQIRVYALLWSRDHELNPDGRRADKLTLAYSGDDIAVPVLSATELDALELDLASRRELARNTVVERPPQARPGPETCRYCGVRHLCQEYWAAQPRRFARDLGDSNYTDAEVRITGRHGPSSWDAVVVDSRAADAGRPVVIRAAQGAIDPRKGDTLRLLDVRVAVEPDDDAKPMVLTMGTFSEAYIVGSP